MVLFELINGRKGISDVLILITAYGEPLSFHELLFILKYYFDSEIEWARREDKEKGFDWNLRLGFGGVLTLTDVFSGLDLSLASYGRTKRDIDWRFISLGIGGNTSVLYGYFKPVEYNIGNFIPIVKNLFAGPLIGMGTNSEKIFGVVLSVPF